MVKKTFVPLAFSMLLMHAIPAFGQLKSGNYGFGLNLAYNPQTKQITGVFENYSGLDETTGIPRFSCIFYLTGTLENRGVLLKTYYPENKEGLIFGALRQAADTSVSIKLIREHGGCWNVLNFTNEFVNFELERFENWIEIRYVNTAKAFFYSDMKEATKRKVYIKTGNCIYIDKIEKDWVHCTYYGKTTVNGWIKKECLNKD